MGNQPATTHRQEHIMGALLRIGVIIAAMVVLTGGVLYLIQHGAEHPDYRQFHESGNLRSVSGIMRSASKGDSRGIMELGLLLLVLTPISRIVLSAVGFIVQRDRMYAVITLIVLAALIFSLVGIK
jgi:uncharacterized membrane protein